MAHGTKQKTTEKSEGGDRTPTCWAVWAFREGCAVRQQRQQLGQQLQRLAFDARVRDDPVRGIRSHNRQHGHDKRRNCGRRQQICVRLQDGQAVVGAAARQRARVQGVHDDVKHRHRAGTGGGCCGWGGAMSRKHGAQKLHCRSQARGTLQPLHEGVLESVLRPGAHTHTPNTTSFHSQASGGLPAEMTLSTRRHLR